MQFNRAIPKRPFSTSLFSRYPEAISSQLAQCKAEVGFLGQLKASDGSNIHTVRFPCLTDTEKKATIVFR